MYDGSNMTKVIESHTVKAGKSVKFFYNNYTARNPFVTDSAHEVQFVYKELGSLILVDENGKELRAPIKFNNDPTKAGLTSAPIIEGYIADIEYVVPEDPGKDITVIYTANAAKAEIIYVDETRGSNQKLQQLMVSTTKQLTTAQPIRLNTMKAQAMNQSKMVMLAENQVKTQRLSM